MNRIKPLFLVIMILASAYIGYCWDQDRRLDKYFIDQICLDAQSQAQKGEPMLDGPLFYQTCAEMREQGYTPYEIQQIVFKGYDKSLKTKY